MRGPVASERIEITLMELDFVKGLFFSHNFFFFFDFVFILGVGSLLKSFYLHTWSRLKVSIRYLCLWGEFLVLNQNFLSFYHEKIYW